jgi:hypothetical protein
VRRSTAGWISGVRVSGGTTAMGSSPKAEQALAAMMPARAIVAVRPCRLDACSCTMDAP